MAPDRATTKEVVNIRTIVASGIQIIPLIRIPLIMVAQWEAYPKINRKEANPYTLNHDLAIAAMLTKKVINYG
jgi:hypothetical protein